MRSISNKFVELALFCHGYKKNFYYFDPANVVQIDDKSIQGNVQFRIPAYLRTTEKDYIFNNTETVLATNQITYFLIALTEHPNLFTSDIVDLKEVAALYKDFDARAVVRNQTFSFNKPVITEKGKCPFSATIKNTRLTKSGHKFINVQIFIGEEKNFEITTTVVLIKESIHKSKYSMNKHV